MLALEKKELPRHLIAGFEAFFASFFLFGKFHLRISNSPSAM